MLGIQEEVIQLKLHYHYNLLLVYEALNYLTELRSGED